MSASISTAVSTPVPASPGQVSPGQASRIDSTRDRDPAASGAGPSETRTASAAPPPAAPPPPPASSPRGKTVDITV